MAILNNIEYLSMPQQVEKNKDDIAQLKLDTAKVIYNNGDVLPTPAIGSADTYIVVCKNATDEGLLDAGIGGTTLYFNSSPIIIISNKLDTIYVNIPGAVGFTPPNLLFTSDYISLMKLY